MSQNFTHLKQIAPGFFNLRGNLTFFMGAVDIGTHMSFIKLENGRILIIDTCNVSQSAKREIDVLTNNGELIEAVVATHPFHTIYFPIFYAMYPNAKYYGTPRHLRRFTNIPWAGDVSKSSILQLWEPEVSMRIPDGAEFINPEENNHFSNVFVYHHASKTLFNDDTVMFFQNPGCILRLAGVTHNSMVLHTSIKSNGLLPTHEAADQFRSWYLKILEDWEIENICTAHNGVKIGGASAMMRATLEASETVLREHSLKYRSTTTANPSHST